MTPADPVHAAIAARPSTLRLAVSRRMLRVRRLRSGGFIHGDILATCLGALCQAMVTAGIPDAALQIREGRDVLCTVWSFHETAAVAAQPLRNGAADRPSARRRRGRP